MTEFRLARTWFDWLRFGTLLLGGSLILGNAVYNAIDHNWGHAVFYAALGGSAVVLAFMVISTDPRVRRLASWNGRRSPR